MNSTQKVIKYGALAFAFLLIIFIISSLLGGLAFVANIFDAGDNIGEMHDVELDISKDNNLDSNIRNLEIDLSSSSLSIVTSDKFALKSNSDSIKTKVKGSTLKIQDKSFNFFGNNEGAQIILYLPDNMNFREVDLDLGAGKVDIDNLVTDKLDLDAGAGLIKINNLKVNDEANIDGGVGKFDVANGYIRNLELDTGVGSTNISAILQGRNEIECGVGDVTINLLDTLDNYRINVDKGIGSAKINGDSISSGQTIGSGNETINIDGGAGNFNINTNN